MNCFLLFEMQDLVLFRPPQMSSNKCHYSWLILSEREDDARIIDKESELWYSEMSLMDKLAQKKGQHVNFNVNGKQVPYIIVQQGIENFEEDLKTLKEEMKISDEIVCVEESNQADATIDCPQSTQKATSNTTVAVAVFIVLFLTESNFSL